MNLFSRHIYPFLIAFFSLLGLFSCVDDKLSMEQHNAGLDGVAEGGALYLALDIPGGFDDPHTSRLSDFDEEIVVNPDNFNVVFFRANGTFLKEFKNQEITEFIDENDPDFENRKKYYVKIPTEDLSADVVNYIRENDFKIAVFANWAGYPDFTNTPETPDLTNTQFTKDANGIYHNNIFYITHCLADESYTSSSNPDEADDSETLFFVTGAGFKMGWYQDWLAIRFPSDQAAEDAIRNNYDVNKAVFHSNTKPQLSNAARVKITFTDMKDYDYYNVWQLWNFGGQDNLNKDKCYTTDNSDIKTAWATLNNDWKKKLFPDNYDNTKDNYLEEDITVRGLKLGTNPKDNTDDSKKPYTPQGDEKCVVLRATDRSASESVKFSTDDGNYLSFQLPADGYLYITCRAIPKNDGEKPTLVVRKGTFGSTSSIKLFSYEVNETLATYTFSYKKDHGETIRVTGTPSDFAIYAINGDIAIYEIDYVKSRMVQNADKQMINPANTPEGGISMYGIQDFKAVGTDVWPEGTAFDLSSKLPTSTGDEAKLNEYPFRTIYLLRSVAKVEVLLPKSIFPEPQHMFLRTLNRFSRSAPLDVFTPTNVIWNGYSADEKYPEEVKGASYKTDNISDVSRTHVYKDALGVDQEIEDIKKKGFTYSNEAFSSEAAEKEAYQNKIAWLFGIWNTEFGWDWANRNITITGEGPYPRIFNTRINRSDYAHMIDGGTVGVTADGGIDTNGDDYYYYYAYVPEKNVTDPNNNATMSESPKVIRIEMRFDRSTDDNLDDNASYRIYFAPGGGGGTTNRDSYDSKWESGSSDDLKKIYPVMRNHLYRFKVTGLRMNQLNVDFEVKSPDSRKISYTID